MLPVCIPLQSVPKIVGCVVLPPSNQLLSGQTDFRAHIGSPLVNFSHHVQTFILTCALFCTGYLLLFLASFFATFLLFLAMLLHQSSYLYCCRKPPMNHPTVEREKEGDPQSARVPPPHELTEDKCRPTSGLSAFHTALPAAVTRERERWKEATVWTR